MGHGFVLVRERLELTWAAYGVAVAPTVGLFEKGKVGSSGDRHTWCGGTHNTGDPHLVEPAGRDGCPGCGRWEEPNFEEPQARVGYQLEAAAGAFTTCTRQMERTNAICVVLPLTSTPTPLLYG
ncbi:unnamed protein product [Schistocephalus solidus]|uniref:Uncharacterized protein n=1 Tax=Schistocephalus solidus TaxID=70667 RepID=A0A183SU04_SCHSO|nr:unnamed protein product [Schistocephalus solidus]